ncbi:MAG: uridine diphosphate-N-acetylglucosamine-binding protein YvcK [Vampirovibrionales bacterium]
MAKSRSFLKTLTWMLPGYEIKRWLLMFAVGFSLVVLGVAILFNLQPVTFILNIIKSLATLAPSHVTGACLLALGIGFLVFGYLRTRKTMNTVMGENGWVTKFMDDLYKNHKLARGPKIVAIGGGTGLSTLLRGLKTYTNNITAIVTVGDDGGSSGILREDHGIIPPGDIRNCIAALASEEELMTSLFQYRFKSGGGLGGHSFGNLFLTAMSAVTGDMLSAIRTSSNVLNIRGRVLPSTLEPITLIAEMEDGSLIRGESQIPEAKRKIKRLFCEPFNAKPTDEAIEAILQADLIILGPGSLFTSVIPNLLLKEIREAMQTNTHAPKIYVANIVTQPGETDDMSLSQHVEAIEAHADHLFQFDMVVASSALPEHLVARYERYESPPVTLDTERLRIRGTEVLLRPIVAEITAGNKTLRHNPHKVARVVVSWLRKYQRQHRRTIQVTPILAEV